MKIRDNLKIEKGFTLIEILMALFIGLILTAAVYISMNSAQRSSTGVERKVAAQQDVRAALEVMAMEISMASFNPNFMPAGIWKNPPNAPTDPCTAASVNQAWKGIQEVTPTSLTVEMDIIRNGIIGPPDNSEIIRYAYDGTNTQSIIRNVNCGGDASFLGMDPSLPAGTNAARVINNTLGLNNGNGVPAIFRYYDGKSPATELNIDTRTGTNTNLIADIRRIDIVLGVETEEVDPNTNQKKRMIYSTSVLVRNHVLN
jgi:prepilin-type N-terminal cleavage/methylation domain-containing protein